MRMADSEMTWQIVLGLLLLEKLSLGASNEALAGDLLEQCHRGRSTAWFWGQVARAIGGSAGRAAVDAAPATVFALGWSLLFPWWREALAGWLPRAVPEQWMRLAWPRPALLEVSYGVVPTISFVWLGALVYLVVRRERLAGRSPMRVVSGLSASLNVLLLATVALLHHFQTPDLMVVTGAHFYFGYAVMGVSVPVAASLLTALLVAEGRRPRVANGQPGASGMRRKMARAEHGLRRTTPAQGLWWLAARTKAGALALAHICQTRADMGHPDLSHVPNTRDMGHPAVSTR
jgi:hypothetical protein